MSTTPRASPTSRTSAPADFVRLSGVFASAEASTASMAGGSSGRTLASFGGSSCSCACIAARLDGRANGRRAGEARVDDAGEGVDVALGHRRLAAQLLRRPVARAGECQRRAVVCDPEVGQPRPVARARLHEQRAWREVRVDQPARVRGVQCVRHSGQEPVRARRVHRPLGDQPRERPRPWQGHHHVRAARALAAVDDGGQVRMEQRGPCAELAVERDPRGALLPLPGASEHEQLDAGRIVARDLPGRVAPLERAQQLVARDLGRSAPAPRRRLGGRVLAHRLSRSRRSSGPDCSAARASGPGRSGPGC